MQCLSQELLPPQRAQHPRKYLPGALKVPTRLSLGKFVGMLSDIRVKSPLVGQTTELASSTQGRANMTKQLQNNPDAAVAPIADWRDSVQCLWSVHESAKPVAASESKTQHPDATYSSRSAKPRTISKP